MAEQTEHQHGHEHDDRREMRLQQQFKEFIHDLMAQRGYSEQAAERFAAVVLFRLEERLTAGESFNLESQLPLKVRELIPAPADRPEGGGPVFKFHKGDFITAVAADLGTSVERAELIVRDVFLTVRALITEGEADGVAHHLPADMKPLWCEPV